MNDKQLEKNRPLDVNRIVEICKYLQRERDESALYSVRLTPPEVHIEVWSLRQIAPVSDWVWSPRCGELNPHDAGVLIDGVRFFAIFTDEEKAEVLDGN